MIVVNSAEAAELYSMVEAKPSAADSDMETYPVLVATGPELETCAVLHRR
jgi:hypothetical protein